VPLGPNSRRREGGGDADAGVVERAGTSPGALHSLIGVEPTRRGCCQEPGPDGPGGITTTICGMDGGAYTSVWALAWCCPIETTAADRRVIDGPGGTATTMAMTATIVAWTGVPARRWDMSQELLWTWTMCSRELTET
jgi:hypothetical protein